MQQSFWGKEGGEVGRLWLKVELLKELDNGIRFYSMENEVLKLVVVNMGCRIMEILAPDASGKRSDLILGLKNIKIMQMILLILGLSSVVLLLFLNRLHNYNIFGGASYNYIVSKI